MRGFMWAVSASICPIGSLLLLLFAPPSPEQICIVRRFRGDQPVIAFALFSALLDWPISLKTGERVARRGPRSNFKVIWTCTFRCDGRMNSGR